MDFDFHQGQQLLALLERWHNVCYLIRLADDSNHTISINVIDRVGVGGDIRLQEAEARQLAKDALLAEKEWLVVAIAELAGIDLIDS